MVRSKIFFKKGIFNIFILIWLLKGDWLMLTMEHLEYEEKKEKI